MRNPTRYTQRTCSSWTSSRIAPYAASNISSCPDRRACVRTLLPHRSTAFSWLKTWKNRIAEVKEGRCRRWFGAAGTSTALEYIFGSTTTRTSASHYCSQPRPTAPDANTTTVNTMINNTTTINKCLHSQQNATAVLLKPRRLAVDFRSPNP